MLAVQGNKDTSDHVKIEDPSPSKHSIHKWKSSHRADLSRSRGRRRPRIQRPWNHLEGRLAASSCTPADTAMVLPGLDVPDKRACEEHTGHEAEGSRRGHRQQLPTANASSRTHQQNG